MSRTGRQEPQTEITFERDLLQILQTVSARFYYSKFKSILQKLPKGQQPLRLLLQLVYQHSAAVYLIQHQSLTPLWLKFLEDSSADLKRHRWDGQPEAVPDQRKPFDVIAGRYCFLESEAHREQGDFKQAQIWLERGEFFGDYLCIDRLNLSDTKTIQTAFQGTELRDDQIATIITRAKQAAQWHGTAGYTLLAETYHHLGMYFHVRLLSLRHTNELIEDVLYTPTDDNHHCRDHFHLFAKSRYHLTAELTENRHPYLLKRDLCFGLALIFITIAIQLEPYCTAITHNTTVKRNSVNVFFCWRQYEGFTLLQRQRYFADWLRHVNLGFFVMPLLSEGGEMANDMLSSLSTMTSFP